MASNSAFDREKLIVNGKDNPSPYEETNHPATDSYGTFSDGAGRFPITTTTASSYSDQLSSRSPTVIVLGGCPACKIGTLQIDFTFLGVCCAIFLFPIGILCCLAFRQRRCDYCGAIYP